MWKTIFELREIQAGQGANLPFVLDDEDSVTFNGDCEANRSYCGALCCYVHLVQLSEEEARSGRYLYKEASLECNCSICRALLARGEKYILKKRPDAGCIYLTEQSRCSIYEYRPRACREFTCAGVSFSLAIDATDDKE